MLRGCAPQSRRLACCADSTNDHDQQQARPLPMDSSVVPLTRAAGMEANARLIHRNERLRWSLDASDSIVAQARQTGDPQLRRLLLRAGSDVLEAALRGDAKRETVCSSQACDAT
jgi:hypothetical protein